MNYPMIPLRGLSIFPHMVLHFDIGREKSINALEQAMIRDQYVFLASQKDENTDLPTADDFYHVGTVAKVKQMLKLPGDTIRVLVEGVARGKIIEMIQDDPYFECEVDEDIEQDTAEEDQEREEALIRMTLAAFEEYAALSEKTPKEVFHSVAGIQRGGALADAIAGHMKLSVEDNQKVLEALEPCERLETVYTLLVREIEIMGIELDINRKVKEQMSQNQREYYLKEQMRAIQGELGFDDDLDDEIIKWHEQMDELELPADICEKLEKEINRLNRMQPTSAEAGVIRTYIETILALPWNKLSEEHIDLKEAEKILDEDHYGLEKSQFKMTDKAIRDLINYYTRESGVRNLEREIANLVRKVARKVVTDGIEGYKVGPKDLEELLGKKRYRYDKISGKSEVGVVTGLAWTVVGGDTLFIETSAVPGTGKLQLTGQLGDVMQESARTGISYSRSVAHKHGIDENFYKEKDIHIHVPEGAVPKDGPSAGVTMCVAMISTLTGIPVRKDVAMTGEVTLRGNVLPVGGIKEKVLAAHRAGVRTVLLPFENERDIDEIPENVREQMNFVLIKNVDEALKEALVK